MIEFERKGNLILTATVDPGLNRTISWYKWYLDNIVLTTDTSTLTINLSTLSLGQHNIKLESANSCGKTGTASIDFNITEVNNMTTKTITVLVNQPTQTVDIVLDMTSNLTVNVKDNLGNPVSGASVVVDSLPALETDMNGQTTASNVPYGNTAITATK